MADHQDQFIDVGRLRVGHFVFVDLGWISHPFPVNSFKIQTPAQIATIRSLGIERIRYSPERSDPDPGAEAAVAIPAAPAVAPPAAAEDDNSISPEGLARRARRALLAEQRASLSACERQFNQAAQVFRQIADGVRAQPQTAAAASRELVDGLVGKMIGDRESSIRLLSENVGERGSLHAINVAIVSLLLGKACGLDDAALADLGVVALLHDLGKTELPDRLRFQNEFQSASEQQLYQEHVAYGVNLGRRMGLSREVLLAIGQHHEFADGSGFPQRLDNTRLTPAARIVALVNRYDNLCNPGNPGLALTPHEALSQIFAQAKKRFDPTVLAAFIRMMGIYPPGSVIQLGDERYALVVSVNSARPLKPRVIIHDPAVPRDDALIVDLEERGDLGIRRSLRPLQLPRAAIDYLSPRQRICYYFERARPGPGAAQ